MERGGGISESEFIETTVLVHILMFSDYLRRKRQ